MNLCDCYVTKVLGTPRKQYDKYWVTVEYNCYGIVSDKHLMFDTMADAESVTVGYHFLG